jgi:type IV secretory pathway VirJ component
MKRKWMTALLVCISGVVFSQSAALPITTMYTDDATTPLLFYISGDGGMNKFSTSLLQAFTRKGYAVVALDARSYFWKKKEPETAAADISAVINQYMVKWHRKNCIIIGYSFGADVLPFIFNRLSKEVQQKTANLILLSPSATTDFEIHVSNMFGFNNVKGPSVSAEINKITKTVLLVFGENEDDFPLKQITIKNKQVLTLAGGHHYDSDTNYLCNQLLQHLP